MWIKILSEKSLKSMFLKLKRHNFIIPKKMNLSIFSF